MRTLLGRLAAGISTTLLGVGLFIAGPATSAHADSYVQVNNHSLSVAGIRVYDVNKGWSSGRTLQPGQYWSFYDANGSVRIDVDAANFLVDSWKWGHGTAGNIVYGGCYDYRSDSGANPSATWDDIIVVRNYDGAHC